VQLLFLGPSTQGEPNGKERLIASKDIVFCQVLPNGTSLEEATVVDLLPVYL
jgi:hypothetical protein